MNQKNEQAEFDAERYCALYCGYQMKPNEEAHDGLRGDVFAGSGCFVPLLNEFWNGENRTMDTFMQTVSQRGMPAFLYMVLRGMTGAAQILDFRDNAAFSNRKLTG